MHEVPRQSTHHSPSEDLWLLEIFTWTTKNPTELRLRFIATYSCATLLFGNHFHANITIESAEERYIKNCLLVRQKNNLERERKIVSEVVSPPSPPKSVRVQGQRKILMTNHVFSSRTACPSWWTLEAPRKSLWLTHFNTIGTRVPEDNWNRRSFTLLCHQTTNTDCNLDLFRRSITDLFFFQASTHFWVELETIFCIKNKLKLKTVCKDHDFCSYRFCICVPWWNQIVFCL